MTTDTVARSLMDRFTDRSGTGRTYYAVWPGDDSPRLKWDGHYVPLAPHNQVVARASGNLFGPAVDALGRSIPGVTAIRDGFSRTTAGMVKTFDAWDFCQGIAKSKGRLVQRGLVFVEKVEEIPAAMERGRVLWEQDRLQWAHGIIRKELAHQKDQEAKGQPPGSIPPLNYEQLLEARDLLERHRAERGKQVDVGALSALVMGEAAPAPVVPPVLSAPPPTAAAQPTGADPAAGVALYFEAQAAGVTLLKAELQGLLDNDPETLAVVREKIKELAAA
jgi:hypothetical protein